MSIVGFSFGFVNYLFIFVIKFHIVNSINSVNFKNIKIILVVLMVIVI